MNKEMLKEMLKGLNEKDMNEILKMYGIETLGKQEINSIDNNIRKLYEKDAVCFMAVSNLGVINIGRGISLLASLSLLVNQLNEKGLSKESILEAVKDGLKDE